MGDSMMWSIAIIQALIFVSTAPLLLGIVKWMKCQLQNRKAPSILQPYRNLNKLLRKKVIIANTTSSLFRAIPYLIFAITITTAAIVPLFITNIVTTPIGDAIVLVGLFGLARFFLALAGMDTGTSFGGMGSSREMLISAIAEPALLMVLFTVAMTASSTNLSVIVNHLSSHNLIAHPSLFFAAISLAVVALAETGRIPIDNPATHLELTMVHEAMILEYSGRHLALIEWSAQIKFMIYALLLIDLFFPWGMAHTFDWLAIINSFFILGLKLLTLVIILGVTEISLAKLRLFRVPFLLGLAFICAVFAMLIHIILEV
jgi:formate hydrogenlyase subunit 4